MNILNYSKRVASFIASFKNFKTVEVDLEPIFIVGGSRSGTSLLSYLISSHPDLEGLFHGDLESKGVNPISKHVHGYCESNHLWTKLSKRGFRKAKRAGREMRAASFFGLPEYIHFFYRQTPFSKLEAHYLIWRIIYHRQTGRVPLIKDQTNLYRIGLIKKLFPRARFIFQSRRADRYIASNHHKWRNSLPVASPSIGMLWMSNNLIGLYDLERFAPGDYTTVTLEDITQNSEKTKSEISRLFKFLELSDFEVETSIFKEENQFIASDQSKPMGVQISNIIDLIRFERELP